MWGDSRFSWELEDGKLLTATVSPYVGGPESWEVAELVRPPWTEDGVKEAMEILARSWARTVTFQVRPHPVDTRHQSSP